MSNLNIIVPVLNEAESIAQLVKRLHRSLFKAGIDYRIIFIDDRSTDNTIEKIQQLSKVYPVIYKVKQGKRGKAYSILEGAELADSEFIAMIDGDLQYPPEAIPELYEVAKRYGIAVANRKKHKTSFLRRMGSKINILIFEKLLHGFDVDTQSGLKVFKKEIIQNLKETDVAGWAIDMPLLKTGLELGYDIGTIDIEFAERSNGESKIRFIQASKEIALNSLKLKLRGNRIHKIHPDVSEKEVGAGFAHKGRRFVTHTHLPHSQSALRTFYPWQKITFIGILLMLGFGLLLNATLTAIILVGVLTFIYLLDFLFNIYVLLKSMHFPPEIRSTKKELKEINDDELPVYTILCPLYKEARILPHFVDAIKKIDWPKEKLDVQLLLEEDDQETIEAAQALKLEDHFRVMVVPHSQPKTKPKACNYGFARAKGEYAVIYDAEDKPDPLQLKKAYLGFRKSADNVVCLQSKLNYFNTDQNLLTRLFTAEYSLWFDLILPGLQSVETTIPLGGTSNHFKVKELRELHAWDPFNVTEDCDLGARLFRQGKKTALIDSTTYEEANSKLASWIKQRSRWIKGYMQTYLVHMRNPIEFLREHRTHALLFHLVIGMRMVFILINPLLWLMTLSYFVAYPIVGPTIESFYPSVVFYPAVLLLVFGNFIYFYNYMIGAAKRQQWSVIKYVFLVPLYWIMTSIAASVAFYQLFVKPHYWEKTEHGLHLDDQPEEVEAEVEISGEKRRRGFGWSFPSPSWKFNSDYLSGGAALIIASVVGNILNFLYNAYLGRAVSLQEFGTVSLISNIFALAGIITNALGKTVTYKSGYLLGKFDNPVKEVWKNVRSRAWLISMVLMLAWVLAMPLLQDFFNTDSILPFILFAPSWIGFVKAVDNGFLAGNLRFGSVAVITLIESGLKLIIATAIVQLGYDTYVYAAIPASVAVAFIFGWIASAMVRSAPKDLSGTDLEFPSGFLGTAIMTNASAVAFLSVDVILAKHFLPPVQAGQYALLSLTGKMIYFVGGLFTQFITPLVSRDEGQGKDSINIFYGLLAASFLASLAAFIFIGLMGDTTVPFLFGDRSISILTYLPLYGFAMVLFRVSTSLVSYHQIKQQYTFPVIGLLFAVIQVIVISLYHAGVAEITVVVSSLAVIQFFVVVLFHLFYEQASVLGRNIADLAGLFSYTNGNGIAHDKLRILILNWRDTKHVWGGGAEVYIQEIAREWVKDGHKVRIFCGNDGNCSRDEEIDGIKITRRGGFYTVYLWAALYYLFRFRGKYDVIIDCENGIPFFAPLYSRIPKILLIHHVHQDYLRKHAPFPLSYIAMFLEKNLMPLLYRNTGVVTVSDSSKKDIVSLGWVSQEQVEVINPGIEKGKFQRSRKTDNPTFVYLGRLRPYKNIDVAIEAFSKVHQKDKSSMLTIAGFGENIDQLKELAAEYGLNGAVDFAGFVSEDRKKELLARSWVALQPSSFEGWGITVLEANAAGTPVIASLTKGLSDSVKDGETGVLVPVRDTEKMAKAMQDLVSDKKLRERLASNAYSWSKNFYWQVSAQKFLKLVNREVSAAKEKEAIRSRFATTLRSIL